jgi:hypothetical protein
MSKRYQGGIVGAGFNPLQAPNAPTIGTATANILSATVPFTPPANVGGSAVTSYTYRSNPDGFSGTVSASPITVSGLTACVAYTFGVFALNSYGPSPQSAFSNSVTPPADGTFAIFALGQQFGGGAGTPVTNRYTYSGNVVVAGGNLTANNYSGGAAAGNTTVGIFALGFSPVTTATAARNKYTYASNTAASATAAGAPSAYGSAAGTSTIGIFALALNAGNTRVTTRETYTYSSCVVSGASAATVATSEGSAAGNSTVGIFQLGCAANVITTRNRYTYSGNVVSAGGAASVASRLSAATGNGTVGIFAAGLLSGCVPSAVRDKYTYSNCAVSSATSASLAAGNQSAAGNSSVGIFSRAGGLGRNIYTYSSDASTSGTNATQASTALGAAASNGTNGVNV